MKHFKGLIFPVLIIFTFLWMIAPAIVTAGCFLMEKSREADAIKNQFSADEILNRDGMEYFKKKEYIKALTCFQKAIKANPNQLNYLLNVIFTFRHMGEFEAAERLTGFALKKFKAEEEREMILMERAEVHFRWGKSLEKKNDFDKAIMHYDTAYMIHKVYNPQRAGTDLNNIGFAYFALGQKKKAMDYFQNSLAISQKRGNRRGEAAALSNIAQMYAGMSRRRDALNYFKRALTITEEFGDPDKMAMILNSMGIVYYFQGKMKKALEYYKKTLPMLRKLGDRHRQAIAFNSIGLVYNELGQVHKALEYFEKSLPIMKAMGHRNHEATLTNNIGLIYNNLGRMQKALHYFKHALAIIKSVGDRGLEPVTLNNIGSVYNTLGQSQKALDCFIKALPIMREVGNRSGEGAVLMGIGGVYETLGQRLKALGFHMKALNILEDVGDRKGEATALNNIGLLYKTLGGKEKALDYLTRAIRIMEAIGNPEGEATTLNNIGVIYNELNQNKKALECYQKALTINRSIGDRDGESTTLNNIGKMYSELDRKQKALEYYKKALIIDQSTGNRDAQATVLSNLGGVYSDLGRKKEALRYYEKALSIMVAVGDRANIAITINNIGALFVSMGKHQKALQYHEVALPIIREAGNKTEEASILNNLLHCWEKLNNKAITIFYGKLAVNVYQELRTNISGLGKEIQKKFLEEEKHTYRHLAQDLITEGRISEAQQILDMLKEEEYFQFIHRDASYANKLLLRVDFTDFEKIWKGKYNTVLQELATLRSENHLLTFKKSKSEYELKRIMQLDLKIKEAQKKYKSFLFKMKEAFAGHREEINQRPNSTVEARKAGGLQSTLLYLDGTGNGKNAVLHYLVYQGRISVIITTASTQWVTQTQVDEKEFNLMIINYRNLLGKLEKIKRGTTLVNTASSRFEELFRRKKEYQKKLYDTIFKPADQELTKYGATNLTVSMDGVLRYIPLPALWDGENYLVQRYRMALITPSFLKNIRDLPMKEKKILAFGAGRGGPGFPALHFVGREIRAIVRDEKRGYYGIIKGKGFIDQEFTRDTMINQLKNKKYPLVHISSHFKFSPGDESKNQLLLGDGSVMKLSDIRRHGKIFDKVQLLVLSACQTGVGGNGEEIDGFGELAQQGGAKSVIASLWPVADESTKELMVNFYGIMKEGTATSKIEALRQAQLKLAGLEDLLVHKKKRSGRKKTIYASSYFWGPFIMMGNWR